MYKRPEITAFIMFIFMWLPARGQDSVLVSMELDSIEVTGIASYIGSSNAPLSYSVSTLDGGELARNASLSLGGHASLLPGVWVNDRENYALGESMTIRGIGWRSAFGVRGIQVILDGIPLTVADGQSVMNIVDPAFIRKIELIRGPASTYWGNSSGGVVYLSTKPDFREKPAIRIRSMAGSHGLIKNEVQYYQSFDNHNINAYGSYLYDEGYRDYSTVKLGRAGVNGTVQLGSNNSLEYTTAFEYMPFAQHPSSLTAAQVSQDPAQANQTFVDSGSGKEITQGQAGLSYRSLTDMGLITVTGHGIVRDLRNPLPFAIINLDRVAGGLRGTLQRDLENISFNVGVETKVQHDDRTEYDNQNGSPGAVQVDQAEKVWNQAAFATAEYRPGRMGFMGGLRFDRLEFTTDANTASQSGKRAFYALSPSFSLGYRAGSATVYANFSTSFEAPTTTELVNRPGGGNGFNPDIQPEKTFGVETGARGTIKSLNLDYNFALYNLWIRDLLFPYQLDPNGPIYYRNQGETVHRGIEAAAGVQPLPGLSLNVAYTLTDAAFKQAVTLQGASLEGNNVPGVPLHRLNTSASWKPGPLWLTLGMTHTSKYAVNNLNTAYNRAYTVMDAKVSAPFSFARDIRIHPYINVNNLFDEQYNGSVVVNAFGDRYFEPASGRNWQFGVSVQF